MSSVANILLRLLAHRRGQHQRPPPPLASIHKGAISIDPTGAPQISRYADAYRRELPPLGAPVTIVPGVDHMGIVYRPAAVRPIVAALNEPGA